MKHRLAGLIGLLLCMTAAETAVPAENTELREQNERLFEQLQAVHHLSTEQMNRIRTIFAKSGYMGQGNPAVTRHPATQET
jgi:hypothetical protein